MTTIALAWLGIIGGYLLALRTGRSWGHVACLAGAMLLSWEALPKFQSQRVTFVRVASGQPMSEVREPITDIGYPLSEFPFIASVNKPTYHKREGACGHAKLIDEETAIYLQTDAVGDRMPCRNCFKSSLAIALPAQPDSQAQTRPAP